MSLKRESTVQLNGNDSLNRVIEKKSYPLRVKGRMILGMVFAMTYGRALFVMPVISKGVFYLSELTDRTIPNVMRNSLLIKSIQPDQSNLE